ncbi:hypothetical protein ED208_07690 [Stagnimonas aquatica]|uniref:Uncharacterized protein n=1 Tax=Stagnimonas aquatica TaxID=2689987 RepID=A0A3N0VDJ6_9GAMM|nr:hypothetical protein [Stagnimonas aquatica]ROH90857.1 hypothetical protein ED208_07690 [Stagnimonas aquatica]
MSNLLMRYGIALSLLAVLGLAPLLLTRLHSESAPTPAKIAPVEVTIPEAEPEDPSGTSREYVYYPDGGFYYAPRTKTWFWQADGRWQYGLSLPERYWDASGYGVNLRLRTDLPYLEHERVFAHYQELQQLLAYHQDAASARAP